MMTGEGQGELPVVVMSVLYVGATMGRGSGVDGTRGTARQVSMMSQRVAVAAHAPVHNRAAVQNQ